MERTLEETYKQLMKNPTYDRETQKQECESERFKSVLHPDYSEYTTSTITGSFC